MQVTVHVKECNGQNIHGTLSPRCFLAIAFDHVATKIMATRARIAIFFVSSGQLTQPKQRLELVSPSLPVLTNGEEPTSPLIGQREPHTRVCVTPPGAFTFKVYFFL